MSPIPAALFAGVLGAETIDDSQTDNELFFCPTCDEQYNLPETTVVCPTCGDKLTYLDDGQ